MAEVDPFDDSVVRYVIKRHKYDPKTKHYRWFYQCAYDNETEYRKAFNEIGDALEELRLRGEVQHKDQIAGVRLEIGYFTNSKRRREARDIQGAYREVPVRSIKFFVRRLFKM
jgi:hypothetical protein